MNKEILIKFEKSIAWQREPSEDFIYILNIKNKKWYLLDNISKDIWLQIAQNKKLGDIVLNLMKEYDVDYDTLYDDIANYIYDLQEEGLIINNE